MGRWYVPEIFVPRRLKNGFYPLHFMAAILSHRWDSSLLLHQPAKCLCVTCVMFLYGTEFGLCAFLRCAGCFFGAKSSLHWLSVKRIKSVEEALNRWMRKVLNDEMPGDLFLATIANSIEALHLKCECKGITNRSIAGFQALIIVAAFLVSVLTSLTKPFLGKGAILTHTASTVIIHYAQIVLGLG